jgi:hypothetical protein
VLDFQHKALWHTKYACARQLRQGDAPEITPDPKAARDYVTHLYGATQLAVCSRRASDAASVVLPSQSFRTTRDLGQGHLECVSQLEQAREAGVALSTFNSTDVGAVEIAQLTEALLGDATLRAKITQRKAVGTMAPRAEFSHMSDARNLRPMSLRTISIIRYDAHPDSRRRMAP